MASEAQRAWAGHEERGERATETGWRDARTAALETENAALRGLLAGTREAGADEEAVRRAVAGIPRPR